MGALAAGVSIASLPYHSDITAKLSSLRDFFLTLFFVGLGLQIPVPTGPILSTAALVVVFVLASRLMTIFPVLHFLKYGNRASLTPALNLSQLSAFALVLASLGVSYGHVHPDLVASFTIALVITALVSALPIPRGHELFLKVGPLLEKIGFADRLGDSTPVKEEEPPKVVLLVFFRRGELVVSGAQDQVHRGNL